MIALPEPNALLEFLNNFEVLPRFKRVDRLEQHPDLGMPGWYGLASLTCIDVLGEIYDLDVRYAWGKEIWKQSLVDYGESPQTLLQFVHESRRTKIVVYLCESSTSLTDTRRLVPLPSVFKQGPYWHVVQHLYVLMPVAHPFEISIKAKKYSDFATTRCLESSRSFLASSPTAGFRQGGLRTLGFSKSKSEKKPLISAIVTAFNSASLIEQTIQSIINQPYDNLELIVIDGGSTDGTLDILSEYNAQIDYWVSWSDAGIYPAMNKGLALANGYIYHIGADDVMMPNALAPVAARLEPHRLVISSVISGKHLVRSSYDWRMRFQNKVHHQSVFYPPAIKRWGYPEMYRICADYALNLRLYNASYRAIYLDQVTAFCRKTGISNTAYFEAHREISEIRHRLSPRAHLLFEPFFLLRYHAKYYLGMRMD